MFEVQLLYFLNLKHSLLSLQYRNWKFLIGGGGQNTLLLPSMYGLESLN